MATSKHIRKTGATTITKDGKIVGNIGAGKTNVPTARKHSKQSDSIRVDDTDVSTILSRSEIFKNLTVVNKNDDNENMIDSNSLHVIWNLSKGNKMLKRLKMLSYVIDDAPFNQQKSFMENLTLDDKEYGELEIVTIPGTNYSRRLPENIVNLLVYIKGNYIVKENLAHNEKILPETLTYLSHDDNPIVRAAVASNETTPKDVLTKLSKEPNLVVREQIAQNPSVPREILQHYVELKNIQVHEKLASNPTLTPEMCRTLADTDNRSFTSKTVNIKLELTYNPATPDDVLEYFASHCPNAGYYQLVRINAYTTLKERLEVRHGDI